MGLPRSQFTEEKVSRLFDTETIGNGASSTTDRQSSVGVCEVEVFVVGSAAHNFDVDLLVAPEVGATLQGVRSTDASGGVVAVAFEETVLGAEYAVKITNNDGANPRDYDVYVRETNF